MPVIGAAAVVLYLVSIRHLQPIQGPEIGWWWVLGILVFVTERWPVELEFRRSAHSFSLTDVPLTLAIVFASGTHAFVAVMVGALVALMLRRAPAVKFALNAAQFALVTAAADRLVHLAASVDPGFGWITWGAVLVASQLGGVLTIAVDPRRDRADRGPRLARPGAPDVRPRPGRHDHRHGDGARLRHRLDRATRGDAAAADPDPDRLRRAIARTSRSARATRR